MWNRALRARPAAFNRQAGRASTTPSFLQLVQQTRQKHIKLWQEDINNFRQFAENFREPLFRRGLYDVATATTEEPTTAPGNYQIDANSLRTIQNGGLYTINGLVTGTPGTQARIRIWVANPGTSQKLFDTYGNEMLVSGAIPLVDLGSGSNTFSITVDVAQLPANVQPLSSASPWVITASGPNGEDESDAVVVPVPTTAPLTASFSIDAGSVIATQGGNVLTITGTAREPNNTPAVARVWLGMRNGSKAIAPGTLAETLLGTSNQVMLSGGVGTFAVTVDLANLPPGVSAPTADNPYVVTLCDTAGGNEMPMPVIVPLVGTPSTTSVPAPTITDPTAPVTASGTYPISGSVPASGSRMLLQAWPASGSTKVTGAAPTAAIIVEPGITAFTLTTTLPVSGANQLVVSAIDLTTQRESALVFIPTITNSATSSSSSSASTSSSSSSSGTSTGTATPAPAPAPAPATSGSSTTASMGTENIESVQGIGPATAPLFRAANIRTTGDLLAAGATRTGRTKLAKALGSGFSSATVLKMVNRVDLARVVGIGPEYSDLLEASGVDTIRELARRNPADLHRQLAIVNADHKPNPFVRQLPTQAQVTNWVAAAKTLPTVVKF